MAETNIVENHYSDEDLTARVERSLAQAGLELGPIDWSQLSPLDQFHVRGLDATKELADGLDLTGGETILDIGSGLGGPARYLAATRGAKVTGIELTRKYVDIADTLSRRTGLADKLTFVHGDALDMPFPDETFDHAWTQHVAMNIENKAALYAEIYRVLKPGGLLAIYDIVRGDVEPVKFPVPWAREPSISFLASPAELTGLPSGGGGGGGSLPSVGDGLLSAAGFTTISSTDTSDLAIAWFVEFSRALQSATVPNPLNLSSLLGPDAREMIGNVALNLREGRIRTMQIIARKSVS